MQFMINCVNLKPYLRKALLKITTLDKESFNILKYRLVCKVIILCKISSIIEKLFQVFFLVFFFDLCCTHPVDSMEPTVSAHHR